MSDYTTQTMGNQEVVDQTTGECLVILGDPKYPWRQRKEDNLRLAHLATLAGEDKLARRVKGCSLYLVYYAAEDGDQKRLKSMMACKSRLCPVCAPRMARRRAMQLSKLLDYVEAKTPEARFLFATLTVRNVQGPGLSGAIDQLVQAWARLMDRRKVARQIAGWYRAIEITRNKATGEYHPHIHGLLMVPSGAYFRRSNPEYITQAEWTTLWQQALRVAYKPMVHIEAARSNPGKSRADASFAAALEAAKYATKSADWLDPSLPDAEAAGVVATYAAALHNRRLVSLGGELKQAAQALAIDPEDPGDLVHLDEVSLRPEAARFLDTYAWLRYARESPLGIPVYQRDYIRTRREPNPDYEPVADGSEE